MTTPDLPEDPRLVWTPANGPRGWAYWVEKRDDQFTIEGFPPMVSGWVVWSERGGFAAVANDDFERDYSLDIGTSTLDLDEPPRGGQEADLQDPH